MLNKIKETAAYIRKNFGEIPPTAIILGTGLGELAEHIGVTLFRNSELSSFYR